jgi:ureidoacrylate peracid hydrolase
MTEDGTGFAERRADEHRRALEACRAAVVVVDMLNDFVEEGGAMPLPDGRRLLGPINRLLNAARQAGARVFWVCDRHHDLADREFTKRAAHCMAGTWGAEIVTALSRAPEDRVICKRRYSGFFGTDLDLQLRELGVSQLVVTGVVTNICVRSTVHDAFFLGYDVVVPEDCVAATSVREQESTLYDIDTHFGSVLPVGEVLAEIAGRRASLQAL